MIFNDELPEFSQGQIYLKTTLHAHVHNDGQLCEGLDFTQIPSLHLKSRQIGQEATVVNATIEISLFIHSSSVA